MKVKTTFGIAAAMALAICSNSQASNLAEKIKALTAEKSAASGSSSSASAFIQALKNYDPAKETSSSLVSKSQVSSTSGSSSSLSNLLDQRLAAATLQAQEAKAKASAVSFSSGEYIPNRNVDGYSVTASGVKTTPTVNPSANPTTAALVKKVKIQSASTAVNFSSGEYIPNRNVDGYSVTAFGMKTTPTVNLSANPAAATLVNKMKIQSASAQQQAQFAAAQQQAQLAAAKQKAQLAAAKQKATLAQQAAAATMASRAQKTASYYGMSASDVMQFNQQVAKAKANASAGIYYNQAQTQAKAYQPTAKVASSGNFLQDAWALVGNSKMAKYVAKAQQANEQKFAAGHAALASKYNDYIAKSDAQQAARLQLYSSMSSAQRSTAITIANSRLAQLSR